MLIRTFVAIALILAVPLVADAAGTSKYPKTAGVNCGLKNANCTNKCNATPIDYNSVRSINARNECLNNCTIAYDLCLGAPALEVPDNNAVETGGGDNFMVAP